MTEQSGSACNRLITFKARCDTTALDANVLNMRSERSNLPGAQKTNIIY